MSCGANSRAVGRAGEESGIPRPSGRLAVTLPAGPFKQIFIPDRAAGDSPLTVTEAGRKQKFAGRVVDINGAVRLLAGYRHQAGGSWLLTRGEVTVRPATGQQAGNPPDPQADVRKQQAAAARRFLAAIRQQRQVELTYRSPNGVRKYRMIPLDIKGGRSAGTGKKRYVWAWSEKHQAPTAFRLDRMLKIEIAAEPFDPAEVTRGRTINWNLPRDWSGKQKPVDKERKL